MCRDTIKISLIVLCFLSWLSMNAHVAGVHIDQSNNNVIDLIGLEGPLEFDNILFLLAWTDRPNENTFAQEYLPTGESLEAFTQMLSVHLFITDTTPVDAVQQHAQRLTNRKMTVDPITNFMISRSPDGKDYIIDCIIGESKNNLMEFVEFNVYRYTQVRLDSGKKALFVYLYTRRSYGEDIYSFFETFGEARINYINMMISLEIPTVTVNI